MLCLLINLLLHMSTYSSVHNIQVKQLRFTVDENSREIIYDASVDEMYMRILRSISFNSSFSSENELRFATSMKSLRV